MRYQVSGKQIDIGEALREHVQANLGEAVKKYAERPTDANVVFSRDSSAFICEITVHLSTGLTSQAKGRAFEIYEAFDNCCEKIEKQMRRYKRRLKDHHKNREAPIESLTASAYVLAGNPDQDDDSEPDSLQPVIIAEMQARIKTLSVGEAVMQMELDNAPVLVFKNAGNNGLNVVYRRDDGNIGWIDPTISA